MLKITPTYKASAQITGDVRAALAAELARCYERGYPIRDLAEATGRSYAWVRTLLKEAGVVLRARGGAPVHRRFPVQKARQKTTATKPPYAATTKKPAIGTSRRGQPSMPTTSSLPGDEPRQRPTPSRIESSTGTTVATPATGTREPGHMEEFNIVLGDELRMLRHKRGLTRRQLRDRLPDKEQVSLQTLATYELGTRQVLAIRIYQICEALDERVDDLYARVRLRLQLPHAPAELALDLAATVNTPDLRLPPVQAWAQAKLSAQPTERRVQLTMPALHNLAALCAVSADELVERLTRAGLTKAIGSTHSGTTRHKYTDVS